MELLTVKDVAKRIRASVRKVWRLIAMGAIPKPVHVGRSALWEETVINEWIKAGCPKNNRSKRDSNGSSDGRGEVQHG